MELHKIDKGINLTDLEYFRMHGTLTEDRMYKLLTFDLEEVLNEHDIDSCGSGSKKHYIRDELDVIEGAVGEIKHALDTFKSDFDGVEISRLSDIVEDMIVDIKHELKRIGSSISDIDNELDY
ncbi:MAG TPA: hypothetical protein VFM18_15025 [Methanosarcina sp.]|nr:hypothetical protein [Methanosarcina sp.]